MPKHRGSVLSDTASLTKPVGGDVLYCENPHIKSFLKSLVNVVLLALVPIVLLAVYVALLIVVPTIHLPQQSGAPMALPPLNPLLVLLVTLPWLAGCAFFAYRAHYEWKHTVIELNRHQLVVTRPRNIKLLLRRKEYESIRSSAVLGFDAEKATLSELLFFRNCITGSVLVSEVEGHKSSPVDKMPDIRNYKSLEAAVKQVGLHGQLFGGG